MKYPDGQPVALGDVIELYRGLCGEVVCSLDDRQFSVPYSEKDRSHLKKGILVKSDKGGLVHFDQPEASFRLCSRAFLAPPPVKPAP